MPADPQLLASIVLALITLAGAVAVVYAHRRLRRHTRSPRQAGLTRGILIATGLAFGGVMAPIYDARFEVGLLLPFLAGFGLVHVPAAAILLIKTLRARQS